jgi:hypothetical protein
VTATVTETGHFNKVYEDIFKVACSSAGYTPVRADNIRETNLIHLDILEKLIDSPMAICDLSSRNPNVLFELGLRQAFDKPTVLVQETGTPRIFDIAPLRYTEYRKELRYREVIEDQNNIRDAIMATRDAAASGKGVNSIVRVLSIAKPATLSDESKDEPGQILQLIRAEMNEMRYEFRRAISHAERPLSDDDEVSQRDIIALKMLMNDYVEMERMARSTTPSTVYLSRIYDMKERAINIHNRRKTPRKEIIQLIDSINELERYIKTILKTRKLEST